MPKNNKRKSNIKSSIMKKALQVVELFRLIFILPFKIFKGRKKQAYKKIKQQMISVNLL